MEKLVEKFERTGSLHDDFEAFKDRDTPSRTPEVLEEVREILKEDPSISTRRLSQRINVSQSTDWKILNKDLKLFPYKVQVAQQLTTAAVEKRFQFASDICQLIYDKSWIFVR